MYAVILDRARPRTRSRRHEDTAVVCTQTEGNHSVLSRLSKREKKQQTPRTRLSYRLILALLEGTYSERVRGQRESSAVKGSGVRLEEKNKFHCSVRSLSNKQILSPSWIQHVVYRTREEDTDRPSPYAFLRVCLFFNREHARPRRRDYKSAEPARVNQSYPCHHFKPGRTSSTKACTY